MSRSEYFREYEKRPEVIAKRRQYRLANRERQRQHEIAHDKKRGGWKQRGRIEMRERRVRWNDYPRLETLEKDVEYLERMCNGE